MMRRGIRIPNIPAWLPGAIVTFFIVGGAAWLVLA